MSDIFINAVPTVIRVCKIIGIVLIIVVIVLKLLKRPIAVARFFAGLMFIIAGVLRILQALNIIPTASPKVEIPAVTSVSTTSVVTEFDTIVETDNSDKVPSEYLAAVRKAESYNELLPMSKTSMYEQLVEFEKFTTEAAQYAIDNAEIDWNDNALQKAKNYQSNFNMSSASIYDQLIEYEKFTEEEAQYAIDHLG